jgi:hypothetical protein
MPQVFCKWCRAPYTPDGDLPPVCPACQAPADWSTEMEWPFRLSVNDRRFLKSLRIGVES